MEDQLEDGEILDDDDQTTIIHPSTSDSKESEIDKIIEETKFAADSKISAHKPAQPKNGSAGTTEPVMEDPEIRALRLAALGTLGKTVKDKVDKTSVMSNTSFTRKRRRDSETKLSKYKAVSSKRTSSRDRDRSSHRSSREREREREKETVKASKNVLTDKICKEVTCKVSEKDEARTTRSRVSADMVLGEENRELPNIDSPGPNVEDNYDNVGMDLDSNCSEPDVNRRIDEEARNPLSSEASQINGIIYEGTNVRPNSLPPRLSHDFSRNDYRSKYDSLQKLDEVIRSRIDDIEEAHERKNKLMMELESTTKSIEDFKNDYVKAIKDRDSLRKELSNYEEQRINRLLFGDVELKPKKEPKASVSSTIEETVPRVVVAPEVVVTPEIVVAPEVVEKEKQRVEVNAKELISSSVNDEERLRKNLLEKLKSVQAAKEKGRMESFAEKSRVPQSSRLSPGSVESADEENSNNSSFASLRDSLEPTPLPQVDYGNNSSMYPPRFLIHLGMSERNPVTETCPYEMTGRCKDYACSYYHLRDDELDVRDLILMFIQYRNLGQNDLRKKIDEILEKKKSDESGFQFFVRLLQGKANSY